MARFLGGTFGIAVPTGKAFAAGGRREGHVLVEAKARSRLFPTVRGDLVIKAGFLQALYDTVATSDFASAKAGCLAIF